LIGRSLLWSLAVALAVPSAAAAQSTTRLVDVRVGGLVSVQPEGYDGGAGPYLDNSLGGTVPGASVGITVAPKGPALISVELSSTTSLSALQRGRFIVGDGPADMRPPIEARHRDTLLSVLGGVRSGVSEVKGGLSFLFGTPQREAWRYDDPGGRIGFTVGFDVRAPINDRIAITPNFRYTYAIRGQDALYFGLGKHIVRAGAGVAISLRR
jgi:hypothetical protein